MYMFLPYSEHHCLSETWVCVMVWSSATDKRAANATCVCYVDSVLHHNGLQKYKKGKKMPTVSKYNNIQYFLLWELLHFWVLN